MSFVLILGSYTADPDQAVKDGRRYRSVLTREGIPSVCPIEDFHDMWCSQVITIPDIEEAVKKLFSECDSIVILSKPGMTVEEVIAESTGLRVEMEYMGDGRTPIFYGISNYMNLVRCDQQVAAYMGKAIN